MKSIRFTHRIIVPNAKAVADSDDGYFDEISDAKTFNLSQEDFDDLMCEGGLFDAFDEAFGTIIDDCEEDRIEDAKISQALAIVDEFICQRDHAFAPGVRVVRESLKYAEENGTFWEIINEIELDG